jgi:hypothetical protein
MRVAIATYSGRPEQFADDDVLAGILRERGLEVEQPNWDDAETDWDSFDLVVARTPWDYTARLDEFLAWTDRVGERLENPPAVIRWNSDKRYLADLAASGVPTVETTYVGPGDSVPAVEREIVVKPSVSAGARDSGRFSPASAAAAVELIERITGGGRTAMVQPYVSGVEERGETAVVLVAGEVSHVLRKGAILAPDEVAPMRVGDPLGVAEVMYDPDLVVPGEADASEIELAMRTRVAVRERFGVVPLIMRVDMLTGDEGEPVLLELEAIEPHLYFDQIPEGAPRLADAIVARAGG